MAIFGRKEEDNLDGHKILFRLLERETVQKMLLVIVLGTAMLVFFILCLFTQNAAIIQFTIVYILVAAVLCVLLVRSIFASITPAEDGLRQILRRQPRLVVWIYVINTDIAPAGIFLYRRCTLVFRLIDRREFLLFGNEREVEAVKVFLRKLLPQVTFGYSAERAQWFTASPLLLWSEQVPLPDLYYDDEEEEEENKLSD